MEGMMRIEVMDWMSQMAHTLSIALLVIPYNGQ